MPLETVMHQRVGLCRKILAMRQAVRSGLGVHAAPNPIWDMLLDLYIAEQEGRGVYLWSLCIAAHIPISTAHRKVAEMEKQGLLVRKAAFRDRRMIGVKMTLDGRTRIEALLDRLYEIWKMDI